MMGKETLTMCLTFRIFNQGYFPYDIESIGLITLHYIGYGSTTASRNDHRNQDPVVQFRDAEGVQVELTQPYSHHESS